MKTASDLENIIMVKELKIQHQNIEIERLNNDIKELLKENENKEKVIKAQDNIIKEAREYIEVHKKVKLGNRIKHIQIVLYSLEDVTELLEILDKEKE